MTPLFNVPVVMVYHSVRHDAEGSIGRIAITPERFERHMSFLTSHYRVVPLSEFVDMRASRVKLQGVAAITFDDGYVDNLLAARAILNKYRAPATCFIPAGFVGRAHFWWDAMQLISIAASQQLERARVELRALFPSLPIGAGSEEADWFRVWDHIRRHPLDYAYATVTELSQRLHVDLTGLPRPVTADELIQFVRWPFAIGSHSVSHRPLPSLAIDDLRNEFTASREYIERHTGQPIRLFSYPFGLFDHEVAQTVGSAGYTGAVSLARNYRLSYQDQFDLPRLDGADGDVENLIAELNMLEQTNARLFTTRASVPNGTAPKSHSAISDPPVRLVNSANPYADLFRTTPINRDWGWHKGAPLDRPLIERFIKTHKGDIRGRVLEVKEPEYSSLYARSDAKTDIVDIDPNNKKADIIDDLQFGSKIGDNTYDCVILTQVLQLVPDVDKALATVARILRPGGVLLISVCGISQAGYSDEGAFLWAFFAAGLRVALARHFDPRKLLVSSHGNAGLAASFLMGLTVEQVPPELFSINDPEYAIVVTGRAVKPAQAPTELTWPMATNQPDISVVIPMYNAAETIRDALHSVGQQSFGTYEILVVDDGSTDGSHEVVAAVAGAANGVIKLLEHPGRVNHGLSLSRNLAMRQANGEFIVFLDADDTIHPEKFRHDLAILRAHPDVAAVVGHALYWWDGAGLQDATLDRMIEPADRVVSPPEFFAATYQDGATSDPPCVHSWMVRKSCTDQIEPFDPEVLTYEDQKFLADLSYRFPIYVASTCLCEYRRKEVTLWAESQRTGADALARERFLQWRTKLIEGAGQRAKLPKPKIQNPT